MFFRIILVLITCAMATPMCYAQSDTSSIGISTNLQPIRVLEKAILEGMAVNNLAEALRFELNMELEQAPDIGGVRLRAYDLNSRYSQVLIDGVPLSGTDMFGGHVDLSSIPLNRVERVEISQAGKGVANNSGSLGLTINVVTLPERSTLGTSAYVKIYEQSLGPEYNMQTNYGAKGRHVQQFGLSQHTKKGLYVTVDLLRDAFQGVWDQYEGNRHQVGYTNNRGYSWSPSTGIQGDFKLGYRRKGLSIFYKHGTSDRKSTVLGHVNRQEYINGAYQDFYSASDVRYAYLRQLNHLQLASKVWMDGKIQFNIAYQTGSTRRQTNWIRTADNRQLDDNPLQKMYGIRSWYSKGVLEKPILKNQLDWLIGYETDWSQVFTAADPFTYNTQEINRNIAHFSSFSQVRWNLKSGFSIQPGLRLAFQGVNFHVDALPSLSLGYQTAKQHVVLTAERVNRFPNQREMFTYLATEFSILTGNSRLRPEKGLLLIAHWTYQLRQAKDFQLNTQLSSGYRRLTDRIAIKPLRQTEPQREPFQYSNLHQYASWSNSISLEGRGSMWQFQASYSLLGLKGNDFADSKQYDRFLFHSEMAILGRYKLAKHFWLQLNYRYVGKQPIYSFEQTYGSLDVKRIAFSSPTFHLADLNLGTSFLGQQLDLMLGVKNLFNTKTIEFEANDGMVHAKGGLRSIHAGYGRSYRLSIGYKL
ncbi:TonB-dependent receptor plug domain-containing protein [Sphingobacterium humi]|uniref:TonB-dependent receptor plug domain-containing protein n=1 Tax=Sphingobacterium humi TaxID=1796905 RepID=A0A6N8KY82_9SPHI|nr:TonB-dependent receptor plug domain-containing protein [Sphingobacterium humi]MVZ60888.1 TonB-dependent receptor plug domain-containing protein [Sphingobacterium humi]